MKNFNRIMLVLEKDIHSGEDNTKVYTLDAHGHHIIHGSNFC